MNFTVLVATWEAGLFVVSGGAIQRELGDHSISALASDGHGGALAILDKRLLRRRAPDGVWTTIAISEMDLACCVTAGDVIYAGTEDASIVRVGADGVVEPLSGFAKVKGRDKWYAGGIMVDGKYMGPPLGVRSMAATSLTPIQEDAVLLANVHVGGIPRSTDAGATWQPTVEIDSDVHEVRAHPNRPGVVAAAAAVGLFTSCDGGATWKLEQRGLHALHCSAVAFTGDDVFVSAAEGPFASQGAIYRGGVDECGPLVKIAGGLPEWFDGKVDTRCMAASGSAVAVVDWGGYLWISIDAGRTWSHRSEDMRGPSSVLIV